MHQYSTSQSGKSTDSARTLKQLKNANALEHPGSPRSANSEHQMSPLQPAIVSATRQRQTLTSIPGGLPKSLRTTEELKVFNRQRRNFVAGQLAEEAYRLGWTLFADGLPEVVHQQAADYGITREDLAHHFLEAYVQVAQPSKFDTVTHSFLCAGGWQSLLGPGRAALVNTLRKEMTRNPGRGLYRPTVQISQQELAKRCGVTVRTIQRWTAPGPSLADLLAAPTDGAPSAPERIQTRAGRTIRRKVSKAALQNAYLRLFILDVQHTGYTRHSAGAKTVWTGRNRYRVLPVDPLLPGQTTTFMEAIHALVHPDADEPAAMHTDQRQEEPADQTAKRSQTDWAEQRKFELGVQIQYPDDDVDEQDEQDARREQPNSPEAPKLADSTGFDEPGDVTTKCRLRIRLNSDKMSARNPRWMGQEIGKEFRAQPRHTDPGEQAGKSKFPHQDVLSDGDSLNGEIGKMARAKRIQWGVVWQRRRRAWMAAHAGDIARYREVIGSLMAHISATLNDQAPASTCTRAAALLIGADVPCEYDACAEVLYAVQAEARASGHRIRCRRDATGTIVTIPLFFRLLQVRLGGAANPAYYPDPSERRKSDISGERPITRQRPRLAGQRRPRGQRTSAGTAATDWEPGSGTEPVMPASQGRDPLHREDGNATDNANGDVSSAGNDTSEHLLAGRVSLQHLEFAVKQAPGIPSGMPSGATPAEPLDVELTVGEQSRHTDERKANRSRKSRRSHRPRLSKAAEMASHSPSRSGGQLCDGSGVLAARDHHVCKEKEKVRTSAPRQRLHRERIECTHNLCDGQMRASIEEIGEIEQEGAPDAVGPAGAAGIVRAASAASAASAVSVARAVCATAEGQSWSSSWSSSPALHCVWRTAQEQLRGYMTPTQFETWVRGIRLVEDQAGRLALCVRTTFARDLLATRFREVIVRALLGASRQSLPAQSIYDLDFLVEALVENQSDASVGLGGPSTSGSGSIGNAGETGEAAGDAVYDEAVGA